jgi:8-oxo-dGTP pyrophosphatase MutT (NUDIX family)
MKPRLEEASLARVLAERGGAFYPNLPGRKNHLRAGVLVPVAFGERPTVFLTERPQTMPRHAGEVSFPGGLPHEADLDLEATARREANEEIGVRSVRMLGRLASTPLYTSDYRLEPFVAAVDPREIAPDAREVARLFELSIEDLLFADAIEALPFTMNGAEVLVPIFPVDDVVIYGGTAQLLMELLVYSAIAMDVEVPRFRRSARNWREVLVAPNG